MKILERRNHLRFYFFVTGTILLSFFVPHHNAKAQDWSAVGSGTGCCTVNALAVFQGELYAAGDFTTAGGVAANYIAKWNGTSWSAVGTGMDNKIRCLYVLNTRLYAGGDFSTAGGVAANHVAAWDGSAWFAVGTGVDAAVQTLGSYKAELFAGGFFMTVGGNSVFGIAKWDGAAWVDVGGGITNPSVYALAEYKGELYAAGSFSNAGGTAVSHIAKWNGTSWTSPGTGVDKPVWGLTVFNNELYAGGTFTTAGGVAAEKIAKWDGTSWSAPGSGMNAVVGWGMTTFNGALYVAGAFTTAGGTAANYVAKWDGAGWSAVGTGMNSTVWPLAVYNNDLYAGGQFTVAGGVPANYVARFAAASCPGKLFSLGKDTSLCMGADLKLTGDSGSITWSTGAKTKSIIIAPDRDTLIWARLVQGACSDTDSIVVKVLANPAVDAGTDQSIQKGDTAVITASASGKRYQWIPSTALDCDTCKRINAHPFVTTMYHVLVTDANGCTGTDSIRVMVQNEIIPPCQDLFLPDAFSPNGDGHNDALMTKGTCMSKLHLRIFNRWGQLVFETEDKLSGGWNGSFNGSPAPEGVYAYILETTPSGGSPVLLRGNIFLLR